jgi:hypothetical protein
MLGFCFHPTVAHSSRVNLTGAADTCTIDLVFGYEPATLAKLKTELLYKELFVGRHSRCSANQPEVTPSTFNIYFPADCDNNDNESFF